MKAFIESTARASLDYQQMAELDGLTGIYNRRAIEYRVDQRLAAQQGGTLFMLDMDSFKKINDRYGHTVGDQVLKIVATILMQMFSGGGLSERLVGRIGGDEFVVFLPDSLDKTAISACVLRIEHRFQKLQLPSSLFLKVSMTVVGSVARKGENFVGLFDRVDQGLLQKKAQRQKGLSNGQTPCGVQTDIKRIADELRELSPKQGACCLDYETFKSVFRYEERKMLRRKEPVNMILFTLTDQSGDFPKLEHRDQQMRLLSEVIEETLRMGDLFTPYSSCQYLVMVAQATGPDAEKIAQRIRTKFYAQHEGAEEELILYHSYPLRPAGTT
ncbi:MAG: GGDEF domain-containing protein [Oscillospiraceae bacterium]